VAGRVYRKSKWLNKIKPSPKKCYKAMRMVEVGTNDNGVGYPRKSSQEYDREAVHI